MVGGLFLVAALALNPSPAPQPRHARAPLPLARSRALLLAASGGGKDWAQELCANFNNLRTPAALIASSAFSGAFALQPAATDSFVRGLLIRLHLLVAVGALACELIAIIASTAAIDMLSFKEPPTADIVTVSTGHQETSPFRKSAKPFTFYRAL